MAPSPAQLHLQALVTRRAQLVETQTAERNRAAHYEESWLCRQSGQLLKLLEKQIAACEKQDRRRAGR